MRAVLDSSAVLAFVFGEPGGDSVREYVNDAGISSVNAAEVVTKLVEWNIPEDKFDAVWTMLAGMIAEFSPAHALEAGRLRKITQRVGLSLGDRACLALAKETGAVVVTADRIWADLDHGVRIEVIR